MKVNAYKPTTIGPVSYSWSNRYRFDIVPTLVRRRTDTVSKKITATRHRFDIDSTSIRRGFGGKSRGFDVAAMSIRSTMSHWLRQSVILACADSVSFYLGCGRAAGGGPQGRCHCLSTRCAPRFLPAPCILHADRADGADGAAPAARRMQHQRRCCLARTASRTASRTGTYGATAPQGLHPSFIGPVCAQPNHNRDQEEEQRCCCCCCCCCVSLASLAAVRATLCRPIMHRTGPVSIACALTPQLPVGRWSLPTAHRSIRPAGAGECRPRGPPRHTEIFLVAGWFAWGWVGVG